MRLWKCLSTHLDLPAKTKTLYAAHVSHFQVAQQPGVPLQGLVWKHGCALDDFGCEPFHQVIPRAQAEHF